MIKHLKINHALVLVSLFLRYKSNIFAENELLALYACTVTNLTYRFV